MNDDDSIVTIFMKKTVKNVTQCLKSSLGLPVKDNSDDTIFSEFPQYKKVLNGLSLKVLNSIQQLIDKQDGKGNLLDTAEKKSLEDKFNILVEVNDRLLDKCNNIINFIENPEAYKAQQMILVEYKKTHEQIPSNITKMTPQQTIKLLSSVQVERPQLKFTKQPDNSKIPFRPILTTKPNAIQPLERSLINDKDEEYPHPYGAELDYFTIPTEQMLINPDPKFPETLESTAYEYVSTVDQLPRLIEDLQQHHEIAVDLEHHNVRTYLGITCLLQISTSTTDYVIDTISLHDHLEILNEVFTNPQVLKVFHGSNSDLMWLQRDFGVYVVNMFDTGVACQILQTARKSLSYLLDKYCGIQANKEFQRLTDWRVRPLIPELIEYARSDTHYLLYIAARMRHELAERSVLDEAFRESNNLCRRLYVKPVVVMDDCILLYRKSSEDFNNRQLHALKRLWELRDSIGREEDESPAFVLPNRVLLAIARTLPREPSGVLACCSQDWKLPMLRKYVYDVQKVCLEAYGESLGVSGSGDSAAVTANTQRKNVLDILLSKHDRTEPNDNKVTESLDTVTIESRLKHESALKWGQSQTTVTSDMSLVRAFLQMHQVTVSIPKVADDTSVGNGHDSGEDDMETEDESSGVEIIDVPESSETVANQIENRPDSVVNNGEPVNISMDFTRKRKLKKESAPFDYETALKQMRTQPNSEANKKQRAGKQFQPFAGKKFKKNQKKA